MTRTEKFLANLTPEQITAELEIRAVRVKKQIAQLEEAKKVSQTTMQMVIGPLKRRR